MLRRLLTEIERSERPPAVDELARRLGLDRSVVAGMIRFLEARGRLQTVAVSVCSPGCGELCRDGCPFTAMAAAPAGATPGFS